MRLLPVAALLLVCAACVTEERVSRRVVVASVDEAYWIETDTVEFQSRAALFDVFVDGEHVAVVEGAEQPDGRVQVWTEPAAGEAPFGPGDRVELVRRTDLRPPDRGRAGVDSVPPSPGDAAAGKKRRVLLLRLEIEPELAPPK
jgi:hypothetical protein